MNSTFQLSSTLLNWFEVHGRHDLPWQHPRTPYRVWVSEIMLQQTQVATVILYFNRFVDAFPSVQTLAEAPLDDVLKCWAGLGYYARARNLHKAAKTIVNEFHGELPANLQSLQALAGIGRSTAGAILAQGFNLHATILDGNVKRIMTRYEAIKGWPGTASTERKLWRCAEQHTPKDRIADYTQAIMDLGATVCKRHQPLCTACPLRTNCQAYLSGRTAELPTRKPKKQIPTIERYVLVRISSNSEIYLERRPESGIWGGLYSFPESAKDVSFKEAITEFQTRYQLPLTNFSLGDPIKHAFSHYRLIMRPIISQQKKLIRIEDGTGRWFIAPIKTIGLPSPVEKWLSRKDILETLQS